MIRIGDIIGHIMAQIDHLESVNTSNNYHESSCAEACESYSVAYGEEFDMNALRCQNVRQL